MKKKDVTMINLAGRRVILRLDLNVPIEDGKILDDSRIIAALDTIKYLRSKNAKIIIISHLGRPDALIKSEYSLLPVKKRLEYLIGDSILFAKDHIGSDAFTKSSNLKNSQILLIENIRFDKREESGCDFFAQQLSKLGEVFIFDAFGVSHRNHASVSKIGKYLESGMGFLIKKEIKAFNDIMNIARQGDSLAIIGGKKVKDKLILIRNIIKNVNVIIISGAMSYTFLKADGFNVGKSIVDETLLKEAKEVLVLANKKGVKVILPIDHICNTDANSTKPPVYFKQAIEDEYMGLDVGPQTLKLYSETIKKAKSIIWNGPIGLFENKLYSNGTFKTAKMISKSSGFSYVGGGDTAYALRKSGYNKNINYISSGGGASLSLLKGEVLPGIEGLEDAE